MKDSTSTVFYLEKSWKIDDFWHLLKSLGQKYITKYIELTFNSIGNIYCVKGYSYIQMCMECWCQCRHADAKISKWLLLLILLALYGKEGVWYKDECILCLLKWFPITTRQTYFVFICSKSIIKAVKQDLKHVLSWNLKIDTPERQLSLLLTLNIFLTCF